LAADILAMRPTASVLLSIDVDGIRINFHFFTENEIEGDLDPREIDSDERLGKLLRFLRTVGQGLSREVRLTPENCSDTVLLAYSPREDAWRCTHPGN
jgi:hypothetical protein